MGTTCSSLLLWSSVLLLLLLSQRLRPMPRLMLLSFTEPTDMPVCHTPVMPDMPMELTHMPMVLTTERDRLMLMLTMDTADMPDLMPMVTDHMDTQLMVTTERDLLMLSQRLMLMLSMESTDTLPTDHMSIVPTDHMLTPPDGDMERDLLMLKPRLTQLSSTPTLSQLSTLLSEPTLLSDPHLSTTHMPSQLSLRPLSPPSPLPRPLTTVLSELMPDSSTPPTPESASTTLESRSHAKCAINLETDVQ